MSGPAPTFTKEELRQRKNARARELYRRRIARGVCARCEAPLKTKTLCAGCAADHAERMKTP